jgi:GNAT superfamily N-acetyltransferase
MEPNKFDFTIQKATIGDSGLIFNWRNDVVTRRMSINPDEISHHDHTLWFSKALESTNEIILLGNFKKIPIGIIRFTLTEMESASVSINLDPKYRGKGFGKLLLNQGIKWVEMNLKQIKSIEAKIKKENYVSVSMFESCGFLLSEEEFLTSTNKYVKLITS